MVKLPKSLEDSLRNDAPDRSRLMLERLSQTLGEDWPMERHPELDAKVYAPRRQMELIQEPVEQISRVGQEKSYLKQDFDGRTLYVSSVMATQADVTRLIDLLTAMRTLVPEKIDADA